MSPFRKFHLRDVTESDLPILFEQQREEESNRMAAFPARDREAFFDHWRNKVFPDLSGIKKAIVVDNEVTGDIVSWEQDGKRLVGYWIGKKYWGQGIASAALAQFLTLIKIRPLFAYVAKHNVASIRVLTKCGFKILSEGHFYSEVHGCEIPELILIHDGM